MQDLGHDKDKIRGFAEMVWHVRHGRVAVELLGLQDHPTSAAHSKHSRHRAHYRVVYHADSWTKYSMAIPPVETTQPGDQRQPNATVHDDASDVKRASVLDHIRSAFGDSF